MSVPSALSARVNGISAAVIRLRRRTVIRSEPQPVGDRIDQPLAHKAALVAAGCAVGRRRGLVGQTEMAGHAIGRDAVGAGSMAIVISGTRAPWVRT